MDKVISDVGEKLLDIKEVKNNKELFRELIYNDYTNMNIKLID